MKSNAMQTIKELTDDEVEKILKMLKIIKGQQQSPIIENYSQKNYSQIGEKVIVLAYSSGVSAGVHFGTLVQQKNGEVYLTNARRISGFKPNEGISLSAVAKDGLDYSSSKVTDKVELIWLKAIEILSLTEKAINSLENAPVAKVKIKNK